MPLILITGISTSGKSAVAKELLRRGYDAVDIEHSGHAAYYNKQTGEKAAEFGQAPERTKEWLEAHEWLIDKEWIKKLQSQSQKQQMYLCGGGSNELEIAQLCDKVIWLKTDEKTIKERVTNPRDHSYGTKPHELAKIIAENRSKENEFTSFGATVIDATQSLDQVVDEILARTG